MALNSCAFLGNLGADPELKYLPSGEAVCNFSIACTDKWKDKASGEIKEATEWVRAVCFGKRGEVIAKHFTKGQPIYISAKMRTRTWDKDGVKQYMTEFVVNDFQFCGEKRGGNGAADKADYQAKQYADTMPPMPDYDDDIPF